MLLLSNENDFKYFPNWQPRDRAHLYFRLDSANGARCCSGERVMEEGAGQRTGVLLRSQTQMDKMREQHEHSWGLAAWSIIRPGISDLSSAPMTLALLPLSHSALSPGTLGTFPAELSCIKIKVTFLFQDQKFAELCQKSLQWSNHGAISSVHKCPKPLATGKLN